MTPCSISMLGVPGGNLDSFFLGKEGVRQMFAGRMRETGADFAVIEGVMGYYDGIGAVSSEGSAWDISTITGTPTVLVVDCRGKRFSGSPYPGLCHCGGQWDRSDFKQNFSYALRQAEACT